MIQKTISRPERTQGGEQAPMADYIRSARTERSGDVSRDLRGAFGRCREPIDRRSTLVSRH